MGDIISEERARPAHRISDGFSIYLDFVRVVSALVVMFAHAQLSKLISPLPLLLDSAPTAVIVFFVLSGYIIESTTRRDAGYKPYVAHRVARIYSVALPAVILSIVCAGGFALASGSAATEMFLTQWGQWWRIPIVLTFQAEDWFSAVEVPGDGPFWSLHFEVAYYTIFGIILFQVGRMRFILLALFFLVIGPKILLLFPCWWIGVELARRPLLQFSNRAFAWLAFFLTSIAIVIVIHAKIAVILQEAILTRLPGLHVLGQSQPFLAHYVVALLVAINFAAVRQLDGEFASLFKKAGKWIRWGSGYSFSLYLYHRPIQSLVSHFYKIKYGAVLFPALIQLLIVAIVIAIGMFTERKTKWYRGFVSRALDKLSAPINRGLI